MNLEAVTTDMNIILHQPIKVQIHFEINFRNVNNEFEYEFSVSKAN